MDLVRGLLVALAAGGWAVSTAKLRSLHRDRANLALRYLCVAQVALTLAVTLQPTAAFVDRTLGVLDIGRVTSNCLTLVAAASGLAFGVHASTPAHTARPSVRRQLAVLGICLAAIRGARRLAPAALRRVGPRVVSGIHYDATPSLGQAPYTLVYLGYLTWVLLQVARIAHRNRAVSGAGPPLVALGVRTITAGAAIGIAYTAAKGAGVAAATWDEPSPLLDAAIPSLLTAAIIAILVGVTLPAWGTRVGADRLYERFTAWRSCRQLQPLWRLLVTASPQIALLPHPAPVPAPGPAHHRDPRRLRPPHPLDDTGCSRDRRPPRRRPRPRPARAHRSDRSRRARHRSAPQARRPPTGHQPPRPITRNVGRHRRRPSRLARTHRPHHPTLPRRHRHPTRTGNDTNQTPTPTPLTAPRRPRPLLQPAARVVQRPRQLSVDKSKGIGAPWVRQGLACCTAILRPVARRTLYAVTSRIGSTCIERVPAFDEHHRQQAHPLYTDRVICSPASPCSATTAARCCPGPTR